ncbi:MAG: hypothetical protein JWN27_1338 [Candidatus Eremiobacteraeota bacterium]|nr:hypothetical protein [Candidatus Eremiobacteraeota bacterium]
MHVSWSRTVAACAATVACAFPSLAFAAAGGVRIIVQQWTPTNPGVQSNDIVLDRPGLMSDALNEGWGAARKPVCDALAAEAGKPDRLGSGFTLYNIACRMAQSGSLAVTGLSGSRVTLSYTLSGNTFKATSTQPSVAGSYADPCFSFSYDLTASTTLHLDTLAVDTFKVSVGNVSRPDSCNAAGDIAKFAATTLKFFGGPDFLAMAQQAIERTQNVSTAKLNVAVDSFVRPLRQYAGQYATQQNWIRHGDLYFAFAPAYVPQPLSAEIGGTIRMQKAQWLAAAPACSIFSIVGNVQTGPAPITDPEHVSVGVPPAVDVGVVSANGTATDAGDRYVCTYAERQLPAGVPVAFRGSGTVRGVSPHGHVVYPVSVKPDGWSGTAALAGVTQGRNFFATTSPQLVGFSEKVALKPRVDLGDPAKNTTAVVRFANPAERVALNPQPLPPRSADTLTARGNVLFARGDFAGAAAAFQRAVDANATNAVALHNLAIAHARLGLTGRATTELRRASDLARNQGDLATARSADGAVLTITSH